MPETIHPPVLVGRARELEILDRALHAAQNGVGSCVLLTGEAGIGKSRLAAELADLAAAANFLILQGYCSEQDRSFPYAPWIDAMRAFLGPQSTAEANELLSVFAPELVKILPELSLLLPSIQPNPPLDPAAEKHRLFESLVRLAASLAAAHPLLIVLEDLHWSDEQSLELLQYIVRRIAAVPILILGTYRSEDPPPSLAHFLVELNRERLVEEIQLAPLARSEVGRMVQAILKTERPTASDWLDLLMPLTEGNPFFVEEITKSLVQAGLRPGQWSSLHIPRSIQHTILRRVEELPEKTRRVLSLASVIGERFDFALLQEVAGEDEQSLLRMLKEMIVAQLIVEQSADQFAFRHALTREGVYATLMFRERKAMHQTIGATMERLSEKRADAPAAPLAYHFYQAGDWQKAMEYSQRAGEEAQALFAPREALAHFSHALEAARQLGIPAPRPSLHGRARAREMLSDFDGARADYKTLIELARNAGDHHEEWQARIDLGLLWQSRDLERAGEYYREALELARGMDDTSLLAQSLNRIGNWSMNRGLAREALKYHREALALFREQDDRHGMARTMDLLGIVCYQLGEIIQGANYLEEAVPILRELDDRQGLVNALLNLAIRALTDTGVLGDVNYPLLTNLSDQALQIAREIHWYQGEALALLHGAISLKQAGEYRQALERLARAQPMMEENQDREALARLHLTLGQILVDLLALSEARQHLEMGLALVQELGSGILTVAATAHLASAALLENDFARAQALLIELLPGEYPEGRELSPQIACWSVRAELEVRQGHPGHALEIVDRLLSSTLNLAQYGPHAVPRLSRLRGQALAALGRMEDAEAELHGT
ncbi:MAG: ATP-binding protein, partial [Omnitrophica WOR_2 bacterium]